MQILDLCYELKQGISLESDPNQIPLAIQIIVFNSWLSQCCCLSITVARARKYYRLSVMYKIIKTKTTQGPLGRIYVSTGYVSICMWLCTVSMCKWLCACDCLSTFMWPFFNLHVGSYPYARDRVSMCTWPCIHVVIYSHACGHVSTCRSLLCAMGHSAQFYLRAMGHSAEFFFISTMGQSKEFR